MTVFNDWPPRLHGGGECREMVIQEDWRLEEGEILTTSITRLTHLTTLLQGVPRNMTVDEQFRMSSSKYWFRFKDFLQFSSVEKSILL